jgi:hypothetical protein
VHVQRRHKFPEGLRPLEGGHTRRQERGTTVAGIALHLRPSQDHKVPGTGAVAAPAAGSALEAARRRRGRGPLALRAHGG